MTWKEFIQKVVGDQLRSPDYWPTSDSVAEPVTQEQLDRTYAALVARTDVIPLYVVEGVQAQVEATIPLVGSGIVSGSLPTNIYYGRKDLGIIFLEINGEVRLPGEALSYPSLLAAKNNTIQANNVNFTILAPTRKIFVANGSAGEAKVAYVPQPAKPSLASVNNDTAEWTLGGSHSEAVVQLIAMHVSAVTNRDPQQAKAHGMLTNLYGGS